MDWASGYSLMYQLAIVDPGTWLDVDEIDVESCSIDRDEDGLMQSADMTIPELYDDGTGDRYRERWVRVYLDARQEGGEPERVAIFTGLATAPERGYDAGKTTHKLTCYSVLKPPADVLLPRGWYAPAETQAATIAAKLLDTPAPVSIADGSPALRDAVIAEDGETALTMAHRIVAAVDWQIQVTGDGRVVIEPVPDEAAVRIDALDNDLITSSFTDTSDWFSCPNVFRACMDGSQAVARDDSGGRLSVAGRGREIWAQETGVTLSDGETLAQYARRALAAAQRSVRTIDYERRYTPGINTGDLVAINYPGQGIDGIFRVKKQSIECGTPCRVSETVEAAI